MNPARAPLATLSESARARRIATLPARPLVLALANLIGLGALGYLWLGQRRKAVMMVPILLIGGVLTCGILYVVAFLAAYDVYLLAQRIELGEHIGRDDHALPIFDRFIGSGHSEEI